MTTATSVAGYLKQQKRVSGSTQLQKLVYYVQAWNLAWSGRPFFVDQIEAWPNGPVVHSVWSAERNHTLPEESGLSTSEREIVDAVYAFYGKMGGTALSKLTHEEEPWNEARIGFAPTERSTSVISEATMRRYFTKRSASGAAGPKPPIQVGQAHPSEVSAAIRQQSERWRGALDALAKR